MICDVEGLICDVEGLICDVEGLICIAGEPGSSIWAMVNQQEIEEANRRLDIIRLDIIRTVFHNQMLIEIQRNFLLIERNFFFDPKQESFLIDYARRNKLRNKLTFMATNETYFEVPQDFNLYQTLQAISNKDITWITN